MGAGTAGTVRRVVVLRALGLGDLLTAVPALRALHAAFPAATLTLAAPRWAAELLDGLGVDAVVDVDLRAGGGAAPEDRPLPRALRGADVAVNLHGAGPESSRLLAATGPRRLLAYAHPDVPATADGPPWDAGQHEVHRWARLLVHYGIACDPARLELPVDARLAVPEARGATLLHPGAAQAARRWPAQRWAAVARDERAAGRRVLITAGPGEQALAERIAADAGLGSRAVLADLSLPALAATVARAARLVVGDTGVGHLAVAVGTPSVALFGPSPPARWGPPPERTQHRVLWHGDPDRPGDPHAASPDPALLAISPAEVSAALAALGSSGRR